MGFRELEVFNFALQEKQGRRILNNLHCLVVKALKSKYHPNAEFLEAKIPNNSTFIWRSIAEVRELLNLFICQFVQHKS